VSQDNSGYVTLVAAARDVQAAMDRSRMFKAVRDVQAAMEKNAAMFKTARELQAAMEKNAAMFKTARAMRETRERYRAIITPSVARDGNRTTAWPCSMVTRSLESTRGLDAPSLVPAATVQEVVSRGTRCHACNIPTTMAACLDLDQALCPACTKNLVEGARSRGYQQALDDLGRGPDTRNVN
jgi:hypothetical protein